MTEQATVNAITASNRNTFIPFQYEDLAAKSQDLYASTKYEILESYLTSDKPLRVLSVGCGSGEMSLQLAARGHSVLGIDIEPSHIELSRHNAQLLGSPSNCQFAVSSIEDFDAESEFDCVASTDVLEHIENDRTAFANMMRALKPGGLVLLSVPAGPWLFGYHDEQLGHFRRYTKATLHQLVDPHCDVRLMRYFGYTLVPICVLYSKWLRQRYPVAGSADIKRRPVRALALRSLMRLDRWTRMPFGTSLLMKGFKKQH
jgi:2-polyprenyl-3-methyl-5-hydroxy-6-metoxy-1,4-benzoquinol methylase